MRLYTHTHPHTECLVNKKCIHNKSGITLISLIVTIIVLLILAGISITTLTGENGIIKQSKSAKEETEISEEKEVIQKSVINVIGNNKHGELKLDEFEKELNLNTKNEKTEIIDDENNIIIKFTERQRYYEIDKEGNISGPTNKLIDDYAGDITKGGKCDGSENNPFEINCIEDLVEFSQEVNSGNSFTDKYVKLMRNLNFSSIFSYNDYETTKYDEYLGGNGSSGLKQQLSQKGKGFMPIGIDQKSFKGYFDGANFEIQNIYINQEQYGALFGYVSEAKIIQNVKISGNIVTHSGPAAGIVSLYNYGNTGVKTIIKNCCNMANISSEGGTTVYWSIAGTSGGIVGRITGKLIIDNCSNFGTINGEMSAGGIAGKDRRG